MVYFYLPIYFLSVISTAAMARASIKLNSCIVTIGNFCPIETIGIIFASVVVLFFGGLPIRKMIESHVASEISKDQNYKLDPFLKFIYGNAGIITIVALIGIGVLIFG